VGEDAAFVAEHAARRYDGENEWAMRSA
jgi:hypothetical protein